MRSYSQSTSKSKILWGTAFSVEKSALKNFENCAKVKGTICKSSRTVVFFGLINIWGGFLLGEITSVKEAFDSGVIYTFSISICAPFLAEVLVRQVVLRKMKKNQAFVFYQMITCVINFLWIIILTFLWLGEHKGGILLQVFVGTISVFFAFYMYCVSQMEQYSSILSEYDDNPYDYLEQEKGRLHLDLHNIWKFL